MFDPRDDARDRDGQEDGRGRVYDERDRDDDPREGLKGVKYYQCRAYRRAGTAVCPRALRLPVGETDETILDVLRTDTLSMDMVDRTLALVSANRQTPDHRVLEAERDGLTTKVENLKAALRRAAELGTGIDDLAPVLAQRKAELHAVERRLSDVTHPTDQAVIRAAIERRIENWRDVLGSTHVAEARLILRQLIGRIVVLSKTYDADVAADYLPDNSGIAVWWTGSVNVDDVLAGIDGLGNRVTSPICASWNQLSGWLRAVDGLRRAA